MYLGRRFENARLCGANGLTSTAVISEIPRGGVAGEVVIRQPPPHRPRSCPATRLEPITPPRLSTMYPPRRPYSFKDAHQRLRPSLAPPHLGLRVNPNLTAGHL